jgi:RNA polymerase sigma-70 factor (ECF subfamily)
VPQPPAEDLPLDLAARIAHGDTSAFELLYRSMAPRLCAYVTRYVGDADRAADLVQQLFLDLWTSRRRWDVRSGLRAYLFSAARNRALNARRHARVEHDWSERAEASPGLEPVSPREREDALQGLLRREAEGAVQRAVAALPERCRLVMYLRWYEGLSYAEVAEVMGISTKGVENQLARGLAAVRRKVGDAEERKAT